MKKFFTLMMIVALVMMSTVSAFATDMEPRLEGVKDGEILAEQQGHDGVWYYVIVYPEDNNRVVFMNAYLEEYLEMEDDGVFDPGQKPFEEIDFQMALEFFLEDDWDALMTELLGDSWTEDDLVFAEEDWGDFEEDDLSDEEWMKLWDEYLASPEAYA